MSISRLCSCFAVLGILSIIAGRATADPSPTEALKFYQMPLNNGATPYLPVPSYPGPSPNGLPSYGTVTSTAIFPGHDELSTATRTSDSAPWQGIYMADDFADYAGTPIVHVRWWGSYMNDNAGIDGVKKFLISFEHNVPASIDASTEEIIPSHPDFAHSGNLHQIVDFVPGVAPPPPGMFTEKAVVTPRGPVSPPELLYEYNAELHLDKWFHEEAAAPGVDNVYWLKIVALVDAQVDGDIDWGWHNRDWSIPDALAAKPGDTPDGAEHIAGTVPDGDTLESVWHFEDDAVQGGIAVYPTAMPFMPDVQQSDFDARNYVTPFDGPTEIVQYSKDLAFELYTMIPEPASLVLLALGVLGFAGLGRRRC